MTMRTKAAVGVAAGLAVAGAGAAYATSGEDGKRTSFLHNVAQRLGISDAKLTDALRGASLDQIDAALAAGRITKAEADAAKARIASGEGQRFFPGGGPGGGFGRFRHGAGFVEAAAAYLGLTRQALRGELEAGKSLADLAEAPGKSVDGLKAAITAAEQRRLEAAVKAGRITAAEEQDMLDQLGTMVDAIVNGTRPAGPPSGFRLGPPPLPPLTPAA